MDKQLKQLQESWKSIIEKEIIVGGKADGMTVEKVAAKHAGETAGPKYEDMLSHIKKQVEMGLKVEKEHSTDGKTKLEITLDHCVEDKNYYTKLATIHKD